MLINSIDKVYQFLLSRERKMLFERVVFFSAAIFFVIHFLLILFINWGVLSINIYNDTHYIPNPISTIYTPFTIILLYEVYSLIYYLPKSISNYLGKQYEIVTLILIRGIFAKLGYIPNEATLSLSTVSDNLLGILYTFGGLIILLLLIFCFYKLSGKRNVEMRVCEDKALEKYILIKRLMAIGLLSIFVFLFIRSIIELVNLDSLTVSSVFVAIKQMNESFFDIFFTALILTEVLLLLFMYNIANGFNKVFRNSGFIISTILLKLSFHAGGNMNVLIILIAVSFGVVILAIYRLFEKKL